VCVLNNLSSLWDASSGGEELLSQAGRRRRWVTRLAHPVALVSRLHLQPRRRWAKRFAVDHLWRSPWRWSAKSQLDDDKNPCDAILFEPICSRLCSLMSTCDKALCSFKAVCTMRVVMQPHCTSRVRQFDKVVSPARLSYNTFLLLSICRFLLKHVQMRGESAANEQLKGAQAIVILAS